MNTYIKIKGTLGKKPEFMEMGEGRFARLSVACNRNVVNSEGNKEKMVDWWEVSVFNSYLLNHLIPVLEAGSSVLIEGSLRKDKATDKKGIEREYVNVVVGSNDDIMLLNQTWHLSKK